MNAPALPAGQTANRCLLSSELDARGASQLSRNIGPRLFVDIDFLAVVLRWMHILAAITAVGGTIFSRVALLPAAGTLADEPRRALLEGVRSRWSKYIAAAILFLLVSGLWNFMQMERAYKLGALYHALFGIKFLLAFVIFFLASVLNGRSALAQKLRANVRFWLTLNMTLAILVVCISGVLRGLPHPPKNAVVAVQSEPGK
jgi:uncharacterized membrane protein